MSDSERIRELEGKLRAWRRGALALAGGTLLIATAGVTVAQSLSILDSFETLVPAQSIVLEVPTSGDLQVQGKDVNYDFSASSFEIAGGSRLKWGAGYSLTTGAGYQTRLDRLEKGKKDGPVRVILTPVSKQ